MTWSRNDFNLTRFKLKLLAIRKTLVQGTCLKPEVRRIASRGLGLVEANRLLIAGLQCERGLLRGADLLFEFIPQVPDAAAVVEMAVGQQQMTDSSRLDSVLNQIGQERFRVLTDACINQDKRVAAINPVNIAVGSVTHPCSQRAAREKIDPIRDLHKSAEPKPAFDS